MFALVLSILAARLIGDIFLEIIARVGSLLCLFLHNFQPGSGQCEKEN